MNNGESMDSSNNTVDSSNNNSDISNNTFDSSNNVARGNLNYNLHTWRNFHRQSRGSNTANVSDASNNLSSRLLQYQNYRRNLNRSRAVNNLFSGINRTRYQSPIGRSSSSTRNYLRRSLGTSNYITDILNSSLNQENTYKSILSREGFQALEFLSFTNEEYETKNKYINNTCCISQKTFQDNDIVVMLPCKHIFNPSDILYWLTEKQAKCPVCRYKLPSVERKIHKPQAYTRRSREPDELYDTNTIISAAEPPPPPSTPPYDVSNNNTTTTMSMSLQFPRIPTSDSDSDELERPLLTRVMPFGEITSDSETDTEIQEIIDNNNSYNNNNNNNNNNNTTNDDEYDSEEDDSMPELITDEEETIPNITNDITEMEYADDIINNFNNILQNLRTVTHISTSDPSNSTIQSRYNFIENAIENSYLESAELQRTLYESLTMATTTIVEENEEHSDLNHSASEEANHEEIENSNNDNWDSTMEADADTNTDTDLNNDTLTDTDTDTDTYLD
jgi:hypothetical protein